MFNAKTESGKVLQTLVEEATKDLQDLDINIHLSHDPKTGIAIDRIDVSFGLLEVRRDSSAGLRWKDVFQATIWLSGPYISIQHDYETPSIGISLSDPNLIQELRKQICIAAMDSSKKDYEFAKERYEILHDKRTEWEKYV